jgi:DNA-binding IclR family transcriptional regulator
MASDVPAVSAAVRILERLAAEWPTAVSPGRLVTELGLNRSTCYNILATLQRSGWAASMGERAGWTLGPRLLTLTGVSHGLVATVVQDEIDDLSRELGFVVFAVEQDGSGGYTVIAKADRQSGVRVTVGVGDRFPFSAPALMQAFHAWRDPDEFDRMVRRRGVQRFTDSTVTDPDELRKVLEKVRRDGYSRSVQQFDLAQGAAATAIFDGSARPSLVVCTLAFSSELHADNVEEVGSLLRTAAERVTRRIGGAFPPGYPEAEPTESTS